MSKPNVTGVQSATEWTASAPTLHMSKPNVTRVQSATEWTASVHTLHMSKPNVTRVPSATEWTASVHTLHMSTRVPDGIPSGVPSRASSRYFGKDLLHWARTVGLCGLWCVGWVGGIFVVFIWWVATLA